MDEIFLIKTTDGWNIRKKRTASTDCFHLKSVIWAIILRFRPSVSFCRDFLTNTTCSGRLSGQWSAWPPNWSPFHNQCGSFEEDAERVNLYDGGGQIHKVSGQCHWRICSSRVSLPGRPHQTARATNSSKPSNSWWGHLLGRKDQTLQLREAWGITWR